MSFIDQKDNWVYFVNQQGCPCDSGSRILQENNLLSIVKDTIAGRTKLTKSSNRYLTALTIDDNVSILSQVNTLRDTLHSLLDVTMELGLKNISISKDNVNSIPWSVTDKYLRKVFIDSTTICCNRIVTSIQSERTKTITKNHSIAIGGHKGVNKTLKRIKHEYS